jgi:hypothetical protein
MVTHNCGMILGLQVKTGSDSGTAEKGNKLKKRGRSLCDAQNAED